MTISERIVQILSNDRSKTQRGLAEAAGVSPQTLNNWLTKGRSIPAERIINICGYLKISVYGLLTGEEDKYSSISQEDREWLDLIHSLPPETQRDFQGAMRIHADLHKMVSRREAEEFEEDLPAKQAK